MQSFAQFTCLGQPGGCRAVSALESNAMKVFWWVSVVVAVVVVAATATVGVAYHQAYSEVESAPAYELAPAELPVTPVDPALADASGNASPAVGFQPPAIAGSVGASVFDLNSQHLVYEHNAQQQFVPASSTKVLTATAALATMDLDKRLHTVIEQEGGRVVIRAAGDVWLDDADLDAAAAVIGQADSVEIDTSLWDGPTQAEGWDPANVAEGYIAPMEPAMLHGARIGATTGDVPRSTSPAFDVAQALADRVGATQVGIYDGAPSMPEVAVMKSPILRERLELMIKHSDNVMAEAIGREIAIARGKQPATFADATSATLQVLSEIGVDVTGAALRDNSGLSSDNRLTPATLLQCLQVAARGSGADAAETTDAAFTTDAASADSGNVGDLRSLLDLLPVAGGDGTLDDRYAELSARGYARAKTGTLTDTSALVGIVTGKSGHTYAYSLLVNDAPILPARAQLDEFVSALREH